MKLFNRILTSLSIVVFSFSYTYSQTIPGAICLGTDTTVCQGQSVIIEKCAPTGGSSSGSGLNLTAPTAVPLTDDGWSAVIPMGFTFSFYGVNYTSCVIGANGLVSFNLTNANGYCPWSLNGTALPTTTVAGGLNAAMGCYQDLNPTNFNSGPIEYQTLGTAPNRVFVVLYKGVTGYSCSSSCNYSAFLFFEGSNNIEYHIGSKVICNTWNSNRAIQGTMNALGTVAHITPGRNNSVWTAASDAQLFTPTAPTNTAAYTISPITYVAVTSGGTSNPLQWRNTLNQNLGNLNATTNALTVTNVPAGTTGYFLTGTSCGVSIGAVSDTTWITRTSAAVNASSVTDMCNSSQGSVTATPTIGTGPYTYNWPLLTATTATVNNVAAGFYTVAMTDSFGCTATANVTVGNVPVVSSGTTTLVSCPGGSDGTATAMMSPLGTNTTYLWNDPMAQTTATATGLSAGAYSCTVTSDNGCTDVINVVVTEIPGMAPTITNLQNVTCHTGNDGIIDLAVTNGTAPYNYTWTGSTSTTSSANDLFVGTQSITISDANNCVVTVDTVLTEPAPLVIDSMALDTMICSESSIMIGAVGGGGSSQYIYTWSENGTPFSTNQYVLVDPVNSGTVYTLVLSEVCGSPTATDDLTITFPQDIVPLVSPVPFEACAPDTFLFNNVSVNSQDIMSTVYSFSNGAVQIVPGQDSVKQLFEVAGMYDVDLTVTSNYGCVYTNSIPQVISALQRPQAAFGMSTNPTTIFETKINMIDHSIDAVQWNWTAVDADPISSSLQNPAFTFPSSEGAYRVELMVTSPKGCTDTTFGILDVKNDVIMYAPNSFTPDGDQFNQTWHVVTDGLDINSYELEVFNRWGQLVWRSLDPSAEWDGTFNGRIVPSGSYNWKLRTKSTESDDALIMTGSVMIIR